MPDITRVFLVFVLILALLRSRLSIGVVMMAASIAIAGLYRMSAEAIFSSALEMIQNPVTLKLLASLSLIRTFELILREQQILSSMMQKVKITFGSRRAQIVSMPLLIGLLPSLGGAYFSAPMVKEAAEGLRISKEEKAFVNYWFRHPWEYILPLYPGIMLAAAVTGIPLARIIQLNLAPAVMVVISGFLLSMRKMGESATALSARRDEAQNVAGWRHFAPIAAVLVIVALFRVELQYALIMVILPLFIFFRYPVRSVPRLLMHGFAPQVILLVAGVMLFKETLGASGAMANLSSIFLEKGLPLFPVLCILPFVCGLLTGHALAFVGASFPLILSIGGHELPSIFLAFASGFLGVLLSPSHVCLALSREYFSADMAGIYRRIFPAACMLALVSLAEYFVLLRITR